MDRSYLLSELPNLVALSVPRDGAELDSGDSLRKSQRADRLLIGIGLRADVHEHQGLRLPAWRRRF